MNPFSLSKIPDNLTADEHIQTAKNLLVRGIDGIEVSNVGGRWGPTWNSSSYDLAFLKFDCLPGVFSPGFVRGRDPGN